MKPNAAQEDLVQRVSAEPPSFSNFKATEVSRQKIKEVFYSLILAGDRGAVEI